MEIKLNLPKVFTGKQNDLNKFLQNVTLYLSINKEIYDKDEKKIAFMLSFMTEGDATDMTGDCISMVTAIFGYYFSINNN